ncbi:MAG: hypothetical protein H6732_03900 [Alphaproteobacteria bacterium]|nr:hypothetical protein [Alphaproteobacteria bacterium]
MARLVALLLLLLSPLAHAGTVGFELSFAPFRGALGDDEVTAVPGTATVWFNGILVAEEEVEAEPLMVLFDAREVSPAVWVTAGSNARLLRPGANTWKVSFVPDEADAPYAAQIRWSAIGDEVRTTETEDGITSTNVVASGRADREAPGTTVFEGTFEADWVRRQDWHDWPAVTEVTPEDRTRIAALLAERAHWFAPPFENLHTLLKRTDGIDARRIRRAMCLDAAWLAGLRITAVDPDQLDPELTGTPIVVLRGRPWEADPTKLDKLRSDEKAFCAAVALSVAYAVPTRVVRAPDGSWSFLR